MNLKQLVSKQTIRGLWGFNARLLSPYVNDGHRHFYTITSSVSNDECTLDKKAKDFEPILGFKRYMHSGQQSDATALSVLPKLDFDESKGEEGEEGENGTMNEFLSRFVWVMRAKLMAAYPDGDKETINGMLLVIVGEVVTVMERGGLERMLSGDGAAPSQGLSEDLWRIVWEVSNSVLEDMEKERKKDKMKGFLQCEEVAEMCRFSGDIGIRGDLLRDLRFKWAREKMEEADFYENLERLREDDRADEKKEAEGKDAGTMGEEAIMSEDKTKVASLPKRRGKIKYKIYGLDLSNPKWAEVADKIHQTEEYTLPQEAKPIFGKSKLVTEKILSLKEEDDPSPLLTEWAELLQPSRIDWVSLLEKLKESNAHLYLKVTEHLLSEQSFQATLHDYSMLIDAHAKANQLEDAERIIEKMNEKGVLPDILTATVLVHMYSKAGNLEHAKEAFESLRSHGFQPDLKVYNSMIMAYVNAGKPKMAEPLITDMEGTGIQPTEEILMALLRSFAQNGDTRGAGQIAMRMQLAGIQPSLEYCGLLVEAYTLAGDPGQARNNFDYMIKIGHRPDDRCTASMIAAYQKKNLLEKALNLLLELEKKDGFEPGPATCAVLIDWFSQLGLIDEAEQLLSKIAEQGEAPPFSIHVSLCYMYAKAGVEKKALQALGVLEAKKEQLRPDQFERVIKGLIDGGFAQDARRIHALMEAQGFTASEELNVALIAPKGMSRRKPISR